MVALTNLRCDKSYGHEGSIWTGVDNDNDVFENRLDPISHDGHSRAVIIIIIICMCM